MAIYKGDTPTVLYKGDHHPAALYKGETMLAGWSETALSGDTEITGTYNDTAKLSLIGSTYQKRANATANICNVELAEKTAGVIEVEASSGAVIATSPNNVLFANSATCSMLKPSTRYFIKCRITKIADQPEGYDIQSFTGKEWSLVATGKDESGTVYPSKTMFFSYDTMAVGDSVDIEKAFTTPEEIDNPQANYRIIIYTEQWKNAEGKLAAATYRFDHIIISETDVPYVPFVVATPTPETPSPVLPAGGTINSEVRLSGTENLCNLDLTKTVPTILEIDQATTSVTAKAWGYPLFNDKALNFIFKPATTYYLKCRMTKVADQPAEYSEVYNRQKSWLLYSKQKDETGTLYPSVSIYSATDAMTVGESRDIAVSFKTPRHLKNVEAEYRLLLYTELWTNAEGEQASAGYRFENIMISEADAPYTPYKPIKTTVTPPDLYAIEVSASSDYNHTVTDADGTMHYWLADTLEGDVITRRIGAYAYTGQEVIAYDANNTTATSICTYSRIEDARVSGAYGYLTHGYVGDLSKLKKWDNAFIYNSNKYHMLRLAVSCLPDWSDSDTDSVKIQKFKAYLAAQYAAGTPVTVYYQLASPTVETVDIPTLPTYPGYTHIYQSTPQDKLPYGMTVTAKVNRDGLYGVKFDGGANSGDTVHRLFSSKGLAAGVGSDTEKAVNDFDGIYPWSARRRCCGTFDENSVFTVNAYEGAPEYAVDGSNGEVWVEHSLFYYQHSYEGDAETILISAQPLDGFSPAPIFLNADGTVRQKAYTAAYPLATVDGKATSRSGVFADTCSLNTAMETARTLGNNYAVTTMAEWYTECLYMWVEFATRDLQSVMKGACQMPSIATDKSLLEETDTNRIVVAPEVAAKFIVGQAIGIGAWAGGANVAKNRVITDIVDAENGNKAIIFDGAPVSIAENNVVWSAAWKNGSCDGVLSTSGSPVSNTSGLYNCIYRGRETPYANAFEWISDLLFVRQGEGTDESPYRYDGYLLTDATKYAAGEPTGDYLKLSYSVIPGSGYVKKLGLDSRYPQVRLPIELGGLPTTYYGDYYYSPTEAVSVICVGGQRNVGGGSGPCYFSSMTPTQSDEVRRARLSCWQGGAAT